MAKPNPGSGAGNAAFHKPSFLLIALILPAFVVTMAVVVALMQYKQLTAVVAKEPVKIDRQPVSRTAEDSIVTVVRRFLAGEGGDTLALSGADLNHLIRTSKPLRDLGWEYHLELEDTLAVARASVPAHAMRGPASLVMKLFRVKGYLNSVMAFYPKFEGGKVDLVPVRAEMNGVPAPPTALTRRGELDPAQWVEDKQAYAEAMGKLGDIRIRGGRLLLIRR